MTGIDISASLLDHVRPSMPTGVTLQCTDILRDGLPEGPFDLVYDSGCFHHVAPHRRVTYLERVMPLIATGGSYGIVTLSTEAMTGPTDEAVITSGDTGGGMPFTIQDLDGIFSSHLDIVELRAVRPGLAGVFGVDYLNCGLFKRQAA